MEGERWRRGGGIEPPNKGFADHSKPEAKHSILKRTAHVPGGLWANLQPRQKTGPRGTHRSESGS